MTVFPDPNRLSHSYGPSKLAHSIPLYLPQPAGSESFSDETAADQASFAAISQWLSVGSVKFTPTKTATTRPPQQTQSPTILTTETHMSMIDPTTIISTTRSVAQSTSSNIKTVSYWVGRRTFLLVIPYRNDSGPESASHTQDWLVAAFDPDEKSRCVENSIDPDHLLDQGFDITKEVLLMFTTIKNMGNLELHPCGQDKFDFTVTKSGKVIHHTSNSSTPPAFIRGINRADCMPGWSHPTGHRGPCTNLNPSRTSTCLSSGWTYTVRPSLHCSDDKG